MKNKNSSRIYRFIVCWFQGDDLTTSGRWMDSIFSQMKIKFQATFIAAVGLSPADDKLPTRARNAAKFCEILFFFCFAIAAWATMPFRENEISFLLSNEFRQISWPHSIFNEPLTCYNFLLKRTPFLSMITFKTYSIKPHRHWGYWVLLPSFTFHIDDRFQAMQSKRRCRNRIEKKTNNFDTVTNIWCRSFLDLT